MDYLMQQKDSATACVYRENNNWSMIVKWKVKVMCGGRFGGDFFRFRTWLLSDGQGISAVGKSAPFFKSPPLCPKPVGSSFQTTGGQETLTKPRHLIFSFMEFWVTKWIFLEHWHIKWTTFETFFHLVWSFLSLSKGPDHSLPLSSSGGVHWTLLNVAVVADVDVDIVFQSVCCYLLVRTSCRKIGWPEVRLKNFRLVRCDLKGDYTT